MRSFAVRQRLLFMRTIINRPVSLTALTMGRVLSRSEVTSLWQEFQSTAKLRKDLARILWEHLTRCDDQLSKDRIIDVLSQFAEDRLPSKRDKAIEAENEKDEADREAMSSQRDEIVLRSVKPTLKRQRDDQEPDRSVRLKSVQPIGGHSSVPIGAKPPVILTPGPRPTRSVESLAREAGLSRRQTYEQCLL